MANVTYNWYPGHMTKARRAMEEDIKLVDLLIELLDARCPLATRNPDIDKLGAGKARLVLLNKSDLADARSNDEWKEYFKNQGITAVILNAQRGEGMKQINAAVQTACREKIERNRKKGILNRPMRAMVVGIPNVGKSTFINSYAKRAVAKTGNKPGVTKGKQWIRLSKQLELLDTPGILWPKIDDRKAGFSLAMIGSMNDEILNIDEMCREFLDMMKQKHPDILFEKYDITEEMGLEESLMAVAKRRNALKSGGVADLDKAVRFLIDDFRSGKLGRITLENPQF
ncbi:MAG: ribosome biogenesis GTPase YlqF [Lachnospiraceae bacterium]|nr:ribosome biogenesis GTPase YlqF [Lachnospiraceae bacterium]